ncbi:4-hydroxy-3-methylbut-2-enyl diphosphate reductase [Paracoccaceae bacterium]|nr:4-hydroxy-3-methylbut-2-enyl diphosphate reductase [Paracoccaceae bacterium]
MSNAPKKLPLKKIHLANPRGFCAGVDRAIEMVELALRKWGSPIYVRHEIVHNKHVVHDLKKKGAVFVEELDECPLDRPVIFSAHGVPKSVPEEAEKRQMIFVDATCPLVTKVHNEIRRYYDKGYKIIMIGHRGHPETIGTMGQLPEGEVLLVENKEDVEKMLPSEYEKLAYVTQTTLSIDDTKDIVLALNKKFPSIENPKKEDICYATTNRQEEVKRLVKCVDLMLVVGSENSSNSQRLVDVAKDSGCAKAYLIEDHKKIDWGKVANASSIGITSGASAPDHLVKEVISSIQEKFDTSLVYDTTRKETIEFKVPPVLR